MSRTLCSKERIDEAARAPKNSSDHERESGIFAGCEIEEKERPLIKLFADGKLCVVST